MQGKVNELWDDRANDLPFKSPYEAIILASLIEKETALDQEKSLISGVFIRRLEQGMRLQTDPTVIYALGDSCQAPLKKSDLKVVHHLAQRADIIIENFKVGNLRKYSLDLYKKLEKEIDFAKDETPNNIIKRGLIEKLFGGVSKTQIPNSSQ